MAFVTPTDRTKSVRNRYVIEVFGGVFVLSLCFVELSVGLRVFVIELSQILSFLFLSHLDPGKGEVDIRTPKASKIICLVTA